RAPCCVRVPGCPPPHADRYSSRQSSVFSHFALEAAASVDIRGQRLRDEPRQKLPEHPLVREFSEGHLLPRDPHAVLRIRIGDSEGVPSRMLCDEYELLPSFALRQNPHSFIRLEVPQLFE